MAVAIPANAPKVGSKSVVPRPKAADSTTKTAITVSPARRPLEGTADGAIASSPATQPHDISCCQTLIEGPPTSGERKGQATRPAQANSASREGACEGGAGKDASRRFIDPSCQPAVADEWQHVADEWICI
ncbi:hypothetical protein D9M68_941540 [compost metagenome]